MDVIRLANSKNMNDYSKSVLADYDSSKDYWKVIKHRDGSITMIDDGSDDVTVVDEETGAEELFYYTGGSKTGFIAETIGITRDEVNHQMGPESGWSYVDGKWENKLDDKTVRFTPEQMERINLNLNDSVIVNNSEMKHPGVLSRFGKSTSNIWSGIKNILGIKKIVPEAAQEENLTESYYKNGDIKASDLLSGGWITQTAHEDDTHFLADWHTKGHPAIDIVGEGPVSFPYDLELIKTGKNNRRLLYQLSGKEDYLYFSHIDSSDVKALQALLAKSNSGSVFYKSGTTLFNFPKTVTGYDKSTGPHIHAEMYRRRDDGSYGFANMMTGDFLPDFDYMNSADGDKYKVWGMKLPNAVKYWK